MPTPTKRERKARAQQIVEDVNAIDVICTFIADGGTLAAWCRAKDIRYRDILGWIEADKARRDLYEQAIALRDRRDKDRVVHEIDLIMSADIADAYDEHGALKAVHDMPLSIRRAIAAIEVDEIYEGRGDDRRLVGYTRKVKLWDKVKGIELSARRHKMLTDKIEAGVRVTLADLLDGDGGQS